MFGKAERVTGNVKRQFLAFYLRLITVKGDWFLPEKGGFFFTFFSHKWEFMEIISWIYFITPVLYQFGGECFLTPVVTKCINLGKSSGIVG